MTKEKEYSQGGKTACALAAPYTRVCLGDGADEAFCGGRVLRKGEKSRAFGEEENGRACDAADATLRRGECVLVREEARRAEDGTQLHYRLFREFGDTRGAFSTPCESFYTLLIRAEYTHGGRETCRLPDIAREGGEALALLAALADGTVFPSTAHEIVEDLLAARA